MCLFAIGLCLFATDNCIVAISLCQRKKSGPSLSWRAGFLKTCMGCGTMFVLLRCVEDDSLGIGFSPRWSVSSSVCRPWPTPYGATADTTFINSSITNGWWFMAQGSCLKAHGQERFGAEPWGMSLEPWIIDLSPLFESLKFLSVKHVKFSNKLHLFTIPNFKHLHFSNSWFSTTQIFKFKTKPEMVP